MHQVNYIGILIYLVVFRVIIQVADRIYRKTSWKTEYTRKLCHILIGLGSLGFPLVFNSHWEVLTLESAVFTSVHLSSVLKAFPSVNGLNRISYGSQLFPLGIYLSFLLYVKYQDPLIFYLPVLILSISDPLAALAGQQVKGRKWFRLFNGGHADKTYAGSLVFLVSSFFLAVLLLGFISTVSFRQLLLFSLLIGLAGTLLEAISSKGWDNLTVPLGIGLVYIGLLAS